MGVRTEARCIAVTAALAVAAAGTAGAGTSPPVRLRTCLGERVTIAGSAGDDRLAGTDRRDVIAGLAGDDVICGHDGDDRICGGDGDDEIQGRYGADLLDGATGNDRLDGGPGGDLLLGGTGRDSLVGGDGGFGDTLVGGDGSDSLSGGDGRHDSDFLFGGESRDFLDGGLGARDELYGGAGNDYLTGGLVSYEFASGRVAAQLDPGTAEATGEGQDRLSEVDGVIGSHHVDILWGTDAAETFRGLGGDDHITAGDGDDDVDGGTGSDALKGELGHDILRFGDSSAGVTVSLRDGTARDERGHDNYLFGFDSLEGSYFDDTLTGDDYSNTISGSFGNNTIFGLDGNDNIERAGSGDAGEGIDTCVVSGDVDGCEEEVIAELNPSPFISDPIHRQDVDRLGTIRGGAHRGWGGWPKQVEVGVRRMTPEGCWWWHAAESRFERGVCGDVQGAKVRRRGEWALAVDTALPPGAYLVVAQWPASVGVACEGVLAPSCVSFYVRWGSATGGSSAGPPASR